MHFIRVIKAATKNNTRTKKLINKPSKKLKTSPRMNLKTSPNKNIKTNTNSVSKQYKIKKPKGIYPLQDESTSVLENLLEQGYNMVTFVAHSNACAFCKGINGKTKPLAQHLQSLQYDAPLFEMSHVNSLSELKIWDKNGELPDVFVNYNGDTHE